MANIKITGYAELAAPISTDLVEVTSDPGGTPISKKAQIRNLFKGGGQIAFPATAVPSADPNTMDDYEEGEFTFGLTCGTSGTITVSTSYNTMGYVKNGRSVDIFGNIAISSVASPLGSLQGTGFPFTCINLTKNAGNVGMLLLYMNINALDAPGTLCARFLEGATSINIFELTTTDVNTDLANHIKAATELYFGFTYPA